MTDGRVLLVLDGNSLVHRAFHAQAGAGLRNVAGRPIWAVRGLVGQLIAAVERVGPDAVLVGFDDPDASIRRDRWPQYKAGRADKLETLVEQLEFARALLTELGIPVVVPTGLEADDVLASAARFGRTEHAETVLMTSDRDSFTLIDEHTRVLRILNGGVEASPLLTPDRLHTMLGIRPDQYRDFAALRGDPSDNLPGVRGIGPKTAAKLLCALGTARQAFDDLDAGGEAVEAAVGPTAARRLAEPEARAAWALNCAVMALHDDLDLGLELDRAQHLLPLPADAVRDALSLLQMPATLSTALRVLAHQDVPDAPERIAWSSADRWQDRPQWPDRTGWSSRSDPSGRWSDEPAGRAGSGRSGAGRSRRRAVLPAGRGTDGSEQLALFDTGARRQAR